jgi:uncharacterized membrane protein
MIYLFGSILATSILFVIFKSYGKFKVNTENAIVLNYLMAATISGISVIPEFSFPDMCKSPWFFNAVGLGFLFIVIFVAMGYSSILAGVAITSVASKMSLAIPVAFSIIYFNEAITAFKITGFILAIPALILSSWSGKKGEVKQTGFINKLIILAVFFGSGTIDTLLKFNEYKWLQTDADNRAFIFIVFASAFVLGIFYMLFQFLRNPAKNKLTTKDILGGFALGVPNVLSAYCLIKSLESPTLEASVVFPLNNIGVVILSSILGFVIFKEKPTTQNVIGYCLCLIAIALIAYK